MKYFNNKGNGCIGLLLIILAGWLLGTTLITAMGAIFVISKYIVLFIIAVIAIFMLLAGIARMAK